MNKFNSNGFTVLETMIVMALTLVIATTAFTLYRLSFRQQYFLGDLNDAVEETKRAMRVSSKEIREAADGDNGAYPVELADDYIVIFYSDIDRDTITERVRYFLEGEILKKGVTKSSGFPLIYNPAGEIITPIAYHLVNYARGVPAFKYYNGDYPGDAVNNPLATPADLQEMRLVEFNFIVNINPYKPPDDLFLNTFILLRNLKDNW